MVRRLAASVDWFVCCSPWDFPVPPSATKSAFLVYYPPCLVSKGRTKEVMSGVAGTIPRRRPIWADAAQVVSSYDLVLANSKWTAKLIGERWQREARVLYPPVPSVRRLPKDHSILTVGRFGRSSTLKKHELLVQTFLAHQPPGWCIAAAGGAADPEAVAAAEHVANLGGSGAVQVTTNASRKTIEDLYGRASIYWHAAGFGAEPASIAVEHFGISIVEAMSAGAVPIVFDGGGPAEVVRHEIDGFRWSTVDQLVELTTMLCQDDDLRDQFADRAQLRAIDFSVEKHATEVDHIFGTPDR
jgi:glycosyltransferase involved in cell wall biosynthesis